MKDSDYWCYPDCKNNYEENHRLYCRRILNCVSKSPPSSDCEYFNKDIDLDLKALIDEE
jgi:hypothetical protein